MKGDISSLLHISRENNIHPSEVAKLFNELPLDTAIHAFQSFPSKKQIIVFSYLDILLQKKILRSVGKDKAAYILNKLTEGHKRKNGNGKKRRKPIRFSNQIDLKPKNNSEIQNWTLINTNSNLYK